MQQDYWFFYYLNIPLEWWDRPELIKKKEIDMDDEEAIEAKLKAIQEATELQEQKRHGFTPVELKRLDRYIEMGVDNI